MRRLTEQCTFLAHSVFFFTNYTKTAVSILSGDASRDDEKKNNRPADKYGI